MVGPVPPSCCRLPLRPSIFHHGGRLLILAITEVTGSKSHKSHWSRRTCRHASQPAWAADSISSPAEAEAETLPAAPAATAGAAEDRASGAATAQSSGGPAGGTLFEAKDFSLVMPAGFVDAQPPPPPTSGFGAPVRTTLGEPETHTSPVACTPTLKFFGTGHGCAAVTVNAVARGLDRGTWWTPPVCLPTVCTRILAKLEPLNSFIPDHAVEPL